MELKAINISQLIMNSIRIQETTYASIPIYNGRHCQFFWTSENYT